MPIHYGLRKSTGFPVGTDPGEIHALPSLSGFPSVVFQLGTPKENITLLILYGLTLYSKLIELNEAIPNIQKSQ